ncbi:MAG: TonB family protein [Bdellovibrionaceae bacterium]|nr:TonB family protein [Pseudobdellovibrionaceae bacterium]
MEEINQDPFSRYVGLSIIGHIALVSIFTFKIMFFPSEDIVIQNAIRVDMVALPDKKSEAPAPAIENKVTPTVNLEPKKEEIKKDEIKKVDTKAESLKKTQQTQNKALDRLKAMSALDKLKDEVEKKNQEKNVEKSVPYKGNVINKGSDLKGLSQLQYDEYFAKLEAHVKEQWILPQWLADAKLKAQVRVTIDDRGYITSKEIITTSGNTVFDNKALETMDKASPCPIAPSNLKNLVANEGIIFNFP